MLEAVHRAIPGLEFTALDRSPRALELTHDRVPVATLVRGDASALPSNAEFDVVCSLDVLEHLDDDRGALAELVRVVVPDGIVVLTAPQHPQLWGGMDDYARHMRRYRRHELARRARAAGLDVVRETSFVTLPLPALAVARLRSRRKPHYDLAADLVRSPPVERVLEGVLGLERRLIALGLSLPIGASVLVVARRAV
jgi:SAM-dependent methyltransferase